MIGFLAIRWILINSLVRSCTQMIPSAWGLGQDSSRCGFVSSRGSKSLRIYCFSHFILFKITEIYVSCDFVLYVTLIINMKIIRECHVTRNLKYWHVYARVFCIGKASKFVGFYIVMKTSQWSFYQSHS